MRAAFVYGALSYAVRRKVGCVVVQDDNVIAIGYNGTPPGWDNRCEGDDGLTLPEVLHAEQNALDKLVRGGADSVGADVFVTTAPCVHCAKLLLGARVGAVYYSNVYRNEDGLNLLKRAGIPTERVEV